MGPQAHVPHHELPPSNLQVIQNERPRSSTAFLPLTNNHKYPNAHISFLLTQYIIQLSLSLPPLPFSSSSLSLFMAMTMSDNISASNDWFQFYQQQDFHGGVPSSISDATAVTTVVSTAGVTASSPTLPRSMLNSASSASASASTTHDHLSPEGRVTKPVRRRSRASRRTPTTLLNTDTTNFRAMVQQFTGGPTAPFAPTPSSSASAGLASLGFGLGFGPRQAHIGPTGLMVGPPPAGYHLQQPQQQPQIFQQQNLAFHNAEAGDQSRFFQRLNSNSNSSSANNNNNPRGSNNATDLGIGGFVMDHHGSLGRF